jgi:hypothetical protein
VVLVYYRISALSEMSAALDRRAIGLLNRKLAKQNQENVETLRKTTNQAGAALKANPAKVINIKRAERKAQRMIPLYRIALIGFAYKECKKRACRF